MTTSINIHSDFQKIRSMELSFNPLLLGLMNSLMNFAASRKFAKHKNIVTAHKVTGLDGHRIPVWLIKPDTAKTPAPALVYCHGGAWTLKHSPQHIENAIRYAQEANCCVLFVDYRLAPKNPFPKPFDDCYAALVWAHQNAEKLGIDKQRIAVGGDSAGGALAAAAAQKAVHEGGIALCGQLLLYPATDSDCKTPSSTAFANVAPFKNFSMRGMWETYLGHLLPGSVAPYASPVHGDLSGLAPAYVETAEYDPLHDEGVAYANALAANGVAVDLNETRGTIHGFDALVPAAKLAQDAIASRVQFLRKVFQS